MEGWRPECGIQVAQVRYHIPGCTGVAGGGLLTEFTRPGFTHSVNPV